MHSEVHLELLQEAVVVGPEEPDVRHLKQDHGQPLQTQAKRPRLVPRRALQDKWMEPVWVGGLLIDQCRSSRGAIRILQTGDTGAGLRRNQVGCSANAFDGDEMNMLVSTLVGARVSSQRRAVQAQRVHAAGM